MLLLLVSSFCFQFDILLRVYTMTKKERSGAVEYHASPKESLELHNMAKKERILRGEESG